jgi:tRNA(Met) C34 N-acetyltransferase TmcA
MRILEVCICAAARLASLCQSHAGRAVQPAGALVGKCRTLDQARAVVTFLDAASEKTLRSTVALTAARGRGKVGSCAHILSLPQSVHVLVGVYVLVCVHSDSDPTTDGPHQPA